MDDTTPPPEDAPPEDHLAFAEKALEDPTLKEKPADYQDANDEVVDDEEATVNDTGEPTPETEPEQ